MNAKISYIDENECCLGTDSCHMKATCSDYRGGFNCSCNDGFAGNGTDCQGANNNNALYFFLNLWAILLQAASYV